MALSDDYPDLPQIADEYVLGAALGDGDFALAPGTRLTVAEIAEPGATGVELSTEPVVIFEAFEQITGYGDELARERYARRLAFPLSRIPSLLDIDTGI